jgi:hypothetical protein
VLVACSMKAGTEGKSADPAITGYSGRKVHPRNTDLWWSLRTGSQGLSTACADISDPDFFPSKEGNAIDNSIQKDKVR